MTATQLIVPMDVQAFCVGRSDADGDATDSYGTKDFARLGPDFSVLPHREAGANVNQGPNVSAKSLPTPFTATNNPLTEGVHLHWALPDALVRGQGDAAGTGQVEFPQAPNRWLVVRLVVDATSPVPTVLRGWVVESDRLSADLVDPSGGRRAASRTVLTQRPADPDTNPAYAYIGQVFDAENWAENPAGTFASRTDALGFGDTAFAATYELCTNVFTFHDLLDDLPAAYDPARTTISYLVAGWYHDVGGDPVAHIVAAASGLTSDAFVKQIRATYAWTVAPVPVEVPTATVCSGVIEGVVWDTTRRYVSRPAYDNGLVAAIGNNRVEAISALLASRPSLSALPNVERLLESLQAGLLPDYITDLVSVEEHLHEHAFARRPGGSLWQVQASRSVGKAGSTPPPPPPRVVLPAGLAALLNELNIAQAVADRTDDEIVSRRQQIFADWTKYIDLLYGVGPGDLDADGDVLPLIQAEIAELDTTVARRNAVLQTAIDGAQAAVERLLTADLELVTTEAPRYWVPTDPVVLVAGDDATPPLRHGGDGRFDADGMLVCRTTVAAVPPGQVADDTGAGSRLESAEAQPPSLTAPLAGAPIGALHALLAEVGCQAPIGVTISGSPGSPVGWQTWNGTNPWIPLLLQWTVELIPDHSVTGLDDYPTTMITGNYRLDGDAIDLDPITAPVVGSNLDIYDGTVGLGGRTSAAIETQIQAYLTSYPDDLVDPQLNAVLEAMFGQGMFGPSPSMMAQALGGLRSAMRMRRQVLQIPVSDPLATVSGDGPLSVEFSNVTVPGAVGDQNTTAAEPDWGYHPIIAGQLNVLALRLVDTFGQVRDVRVDQGSLIRSSSLRPAQDPVGTTPVLLRPRLAQPARLNFRWLAADDDLVEANSDPASSPICGWLMFNHLDASLMVYDAGGSAIGAFSTVGPLWQGAPGASDMFAQITTAFADAAINPHLRDFAYAINGKADAVGFLDDLLRAIDRASTLIIPKGSAQHRSTSVLFGRPLAIVRARLDAELHGLASIDESWDALRSTVKSWDGTTYPAARPDAAFADVRLPVRLGDISNLDDGLIGYFIDHGSPATFDTFYASAADTSGHGVIAPPDDAVTVTSRAGSTPVVLTMLVDPRCSVHATTGLLPMKDIEVPPAMYADALQQMAVPFLVAPLIAGEQTRIPVPTEAGWTWSWITRTSKPAGWSQVDAVASPNPRAAFDGTLQTLVEGWLRLTPAPPTASAATDGTRAGPSTRTSP